MRRLRAGRHRVDQRLVAVAQVDRAPQRRLLDPRGRPGAVGQLDRGERLIAPERHAGRQLDRRLVVEGHGGRAPSERAGGGQPAVNPATGGRPLEGPAAAEKEQAPLERHGLTLPGQAERVERSPPCTRSLPYCGRANAPDRGRRRTTRGARRAEVRRLVGRRRRADQAGGRADRRYPPRGQRRRRGGVRDGRHHRRAARPRPAGQPRCRRAASWTCCSPRASGSAMALLAMAIHALGVEARSFTGSQAGVITTAKHGKARIIDVTPRRLRDALDEGAIVHRRRLPGRHPGHARTSPRSAGAARTPPPSRSPPRWRPTSARSTPTSTGCSPPTRGSCRDARRLAAHHLRGDAGDGRLRGEGAAPARGRVRAPLRRPAARAQSRTTTSRARSSPARWRRFPWSTRSSPASRTTGPRPRSPSSACRTSPARRRGSSARSPRPRSTST